ELRGKLPPPPNQDYPEQAIVSAVEELHPLLSGLTKADFPLTGKLSTLPELIQRRGRDLLAILQTKDVTADKDAADEFRNKVVAKLQGVLRDLRGAQSLFVDVGMEKPVDLAVVDLQLPELPSGATRYVYGPEDKIRLRAVVRGVGKNTDATVTCKIGTK